MNQEVTDNRLYASAETAAKVGWLADYLPDISGRDVIFFDPDDLASPDEMERVYLESGIDPESHALYGTIAIDMARIALQNDTPMSIKYVNVSAEYSDNFDPSKITFINLQEDASVEANIIAMDMDKTPAEWAQMFTEIPASYFDNLPGDGADYNAFVAFHEAAHGAQPLVNIEKFHMEINADQVAVNAFRRAVGDGYDLDPAVPQIINEFRAASYLGYEPPPADIVSFSFSDEAIDEDRVFIPSHAVESFVNIDGEDPHYGEIASLENLGGMERVNLYVNGVINNTEIEDFFKSLFNTEANPDDDMLAEDTASMKTRIAILERLNIEGAFVEDPAMQRYTDKVLGFYEETAPSLMAEIRGDSQYDKYFEQIPRTYDDLAQELQEHRERFEVDMDSYVSGRPTPEQIEAARFHVNEDIFNTLDGVSGTGKPELIMDDTEPSINMPVATPKGYVPM